MKYTLPRKAIFAISALFSIVMTSCQSEPPFAVDNYSKGLKFHIKSPDNESDWTTRGDEKERVAFLRYIIADAHGQVLTHYLGQISDDLHNVNVDGLEPGDYSIVFLGSSVRSDLASIDDPLSLDEIWLQDKAETVPIGGSYFFKKYNFTISRDLTPKDYEVVLDRALSKIKVEFPGIPSVVESMISSVTVSLDEGCHVFSAIKGDCSFTGEATIKDYEVCDSSFRLSLSTLPSIGELSGTVKVRAATLSGDSVSASYRFSGLKAEAGKVNTIAVALRHPDMKTGFINIRPRDYYDYKADLMLMEDESMSVFHDSIQRRFFMTDPLVLKTNDNQLRLQLYSAAPANNVDIYANFPSLGIDSVRLVHFDRVEALLDMMVPMTFTKREALYQDIHGRLVTLPKMVIPSDVEWIVKTDDPFLTRMKSLKLKKWCMGFPSWETVWPKYAVAPDLKCMRHAMVQMINLALTLDSEEFADQLAAHAGEYVDSDVYYTTEEIMDRIQNSNQGCYGLGANNPASGHNGWGGGWYSGFTPIIVNQAYFAKLYPTISPETPCNRERESFYHEHAHCLGFTHEGNMTYGGVWTNTVGAALLNADAAGKIFFNTPDFIESLPYKRCDAPAWATPRFAD